MLMTMQEHDPNSDHVERHPDLVRMAALGQLTTPFEYQFQGKWPTTVRRRKLTELSSHVTLGGDTVTVYRLEGASIFVEATRSDNATHVACRAYSADCAPAAAPGAAACHAAVDPLASHDHRSAVASACAHHGALPVPHHCVHGAAASTVSVPAASAARSSLDRSSSGCSAASSALSAFDGSYLALACSDLARRDQEYAVDVSAAWSRWPGFVDFAKRRALVDVVDDLVSAAKASSATTHLAIYYLDKFLATAHPRDFQQSRRSLRLLICVSVLIACKNADIVCLRLSDLADVIHQWDRQRPAESEIAEMELIVLRTLDYRLHPATLRDHVAARLGTDVGLSLGRDDPISVRSLWLSDVALRFAPPAGIPACDVADAIVTYACDGAAAYDGVEVLPPPAMAFVQACEEQVLAVPDSPLAARRPK